MRMAVKGLQLLQLKTPHYLYRCRQPPLSAPSATPTTKTTTNDTAMRQVHPRQTLHHHEGRRQKRQPMRLLLNEHGVNALADQHGSGLKIIIKEFKEKRWKPSNLLTTLPKPWGAAGRHGCGHHG